MSKKHTKYIIKRLGEIDEDTQCSVDPSYTVASLAALISAHNSGAIKLEDECWFGYRENYKFAPKEAPALVRIKE